jgi:hypothetical protein
LSDGGVSFRLKNIEFSDGGVSFTSDIKLVKRLGVGGDFTELLAVDGAF